MFYCGRLWRLEGLDMLGLLGLRRLREASGLGDSQGFGFGAQGDPGLGSGGFQGFRTGGFQDLGLTHSKPFNPRWQDLGLKCCRFLAFLLKV